MYKFQPSSPNNRAGAVNSLYLFAAVALIVMIALGVMLVRMDDPTPLSVDGDRLFFYCAAGLRGPAELVVADYEKDYGIKVDVQFSGSNTLLSQIEAARTGDLFLSADDSYISLGQEKGLVQESFAVGAQRPVIAVRKGNPKNIQGIEDLLREDITTSMGNPDQAAVGKITRKMLTKSGQWEAVEKAITKTGVFKPTVPEVANDVKLEAVDAGIVWDTTLALYPELEAIRTPELDAGTAHVTLGVLSSSTQPTEALRFSRYLAARDKGLTRFREKGFQTVDGDKWVESPELTFYCGSVNRRAVEPTIKEFEEREGVKITTVYNGCGILTGQMRSILDQDQVLGFPDTYMACDVYYLDTVKELFQDAVNVSDTEVVIVVPKGNPKQIEKLSDLAKPGVRVTVGQPDQCTIGVLTRQLLEHEGLSDGILKNVKNETMTSSLLVPSVISGAADATLAYATDTLAEADKLEVIRINSTAGKAIQPFSIARSSEQKHLSRRLYQAISRSKERFETAGFHWRLNDVTGIPGSESVGDPQPSADPDQDSQGTPSQL